MDRIGRIFKELETERDNLMSAIDRKDVFINKIKAYLEEEVRANQSLQKLQATCEEACGHDLETDQIHMGRAECAEGLLNQIEKWENE